MSNEARPFSVWMLRLLVASYWAFVLFGMFPHQAWSNSNGDSYLHGLLSTVATIAVIGDLAERRK